MTRRSSADPDKLNEYLVGHTAWVQDMRVKVQTFADEVAFYNRSASVSPKIDADLATDLSDFVERWAHLDDFVADVARAFVELRARHQGPATAVALPAVLTFMDSSIARFGQIGYADREEAIREARATAEALQAYVDDVEHGRAPEVGFEDIIDAIGQGQYDPAFAVELSNRVGVDGYTDAVGLVWEHYPSTHDTERTPRGARVPGDEAVAAFQILGTTLTTAMHAQGPALSDGFRQDLVRSDGFGEDTFGDPYDDYSHTAPSVRDENLATLLSYTHPPTELAVDIAQAQLTPLLRSDDEQHLDATAHIVSNYAEMLSHDPDASAVWLSRNDDGGPGLSNLDLALRRETDEDLDGGRALADVVENGLLNDNPDYTADGRTIGSRLIESSIEIVADMDRLQNDHMYDALATGVDDHMDLIDHRINDGRDVRITGASTSTADETYDFFKVLVHDEGAADQLARSAEDYTIDQLRSDLPPPGDPDSYGDDPRAERLREIGGVRGILIAAESDVLIDSTQDRIERQQRNANAVNFATGLVPYLGEAGDLGTAGTRTVGAVLTANDFAEIFEGSIGDVAFPSDIDDLRDSFDEANARKVDILADSTIMLAVAGHPDHGFPPMSAMSNEERVAFLHWVDGRYDPDDQAHLYLGTSLAADQFLAHG